MSGMPPPWADPRPLTLVERWRSWRVRAVMVAEWRARTRLRRLRGQYGNPDEDTWEAGPDAATWPDAPPWADGPDGESGW